MKLLIIGSLLFSGTGAVAMQNETVNAEVSKRYTEMTESFQRGRLKNGLLEEVKEFGFPYPCEEFLSELSEEQQLLITTEIDMINAEYDWASMTDEEILDALTVVKETLSSLYDELEIEGPKLRDYTDYVRGQRIEYLQEFGMKYPAETFLETLTEEQSLAIKAQIDTWNEIYDWANMTDEEINDALIVIKDERVNLFEELEIEVNGNFGERIKDRVQNRIQNRNRNEKGNRESKGRRDSDNESTTVDESESM